MEDEAGTWTANLRPHDGMRLGVPSTPSLALARRQWERERERKREREREREKAIRSNTNLVPLCKGRIRDGKHRAWTHEPLWTMSTRDSPGGWTESTNRSSSNVQGHVRMAGHEFGWRPCPVAG